MRAHTNEQQDSLTTQKALGGPEQCQQHLLLMQAAMRGTPSEVQPVEDVLTQPDEEQPVEDAAPAPRTPPRKRGRPAAPKIPPTSQARPVCLSKAP